MISYTQLIQKLKGKIALAPQSISGSSAVDGPIIDRQGFRSGKLDLMIDAASGTPTGATFNVAVNSGDQSDLSDGTLLFQLATTLSALASSINEYNMILDGAGRYLQVVATPTFTGGTSPAVTAAASLQLGDADNEPADPSNVVVWGA